MTTGLSSREAILAVEAAGGEVVAEAALVDRSGGSVDLDWAYKDSKDFEINDEQAEVVEGIFKDFASGVTMYQIAKELNERGVLTNRGGKWQQNTVRLILENSFYTGNLEWEGIINKGIHEAIIPDRLFKKTQKRLIERN